MKLLIADDEEMTREGLHSSISWSDLGIDTVLEAEDGMIGLELAKKEKPEIILTDVRMPRMDGIEMVSRLAEEGIEPVTIFMSGYSDKEYLKAAIRLQAVNYVEKPLNPEEVRSAVESAVQRHQEKLESRVAKGFRNMENEVRLAYFLTYPYAQYREQTETILSMFPDINAGTWFLPVIVETVPSENRSITEQEARTFMNAFLAGTEFSCLLISKHSAYHVWFFYGNREPDDSGIRLITEQLNVLYKNIRCFHASLGSPVRGISSVYDSYLGAAVLIQNAYFFEPGTILTEELLSSCSESTASFTEIPVSYRSAISSGDKSLAASVLEQLRMGCEEHKGLLVDSVKDLYYKLLLDIQEIRLERKLSPMDLEFTRSITAYLDHSACYKELHASLVLQNRRFFDDLDSYVPENPTVYLIREYINTHYQDESLSVREISEVVRLSTTYVCTFFKNETGKTLNQYLTEFRMEKAKQLLLDPRYRISEISSLVGYNDGNYFGKSFKKLVGLSPSEYREKHL